MKVPHVHGALENPLLRVLSCCLVAAAMLFSINLKTARAQSTPAAVDPGVRQGPIRSRSGLTGWPFLKTPLQ
jgi:hypothetical protein